MLQLIVRKMLPSRDKWLIEFQCLQNTIWADIWNSTTNQLKRQHVGSKSFFRSNFFRYREGTRSDSLTGTRNLKKNLPSTQPELSQTD